MIVLIPAYEPDHRLVELIEQLRSSAPEVAVLVVDDGSGAAYASVFAACRDRGAQVLTRMPNRGKGFALKEGFRYAAQTYPGQGLVCADCDGQHRPADILRVAERVRDRRTAMVLGVRHFTGPVPSRSRLGNAVTRRLFGLVTGRDLVDTQTGLRGYPAEVLPWLGTVGGDRFEYELNLLLQARQAGIDIDQVPIETVYLDGNASSHFRPLRDSARIYAPLLRFSLSSLVAFLVDFVGVFLLSWLTGSLLASVVGARLTSATVNFLTNRRFVFSDNGSGPPVRTAALRYGALVAAILTANYVLLATLTGWGLTLLAAKVLTELALFVVSYAAQRRFVFAVVPEAAERAVAVTPVKSVGASR